MATENKTLAEILAGVHNRRDLKRFFREVGGMSIAEAAAKLAEIERDGAAEEKELTRAGIARTFQADAIKSAKRLEFLQHLVPNVVEAARNEGFRLSRAEPRRKNAWVNGRLLNGAEQFIQETGVRMAQELATELDACTTRDELEAKLVRLDWDQELIAMYLDDYGVLSG